MLLLASLAFAEPVTTLPPDVQEAVEASEGAPLAIRMRQISEPLLGLPYVSDSHGESQAPDLDPIARYDAFDCLTFAEEILALSLAADPTDADRIRQSLRYGSRDPDYVHRRHFMELQWVPGVIADGWLRDATGDYGPTTTLSKEISVASMNGWRGRSKFHHTDDQLPTGSMELEVLPLAAAQAAVDKIKPGTLVLTVREDRAGVPLWTTHVGFVVETDKGLTHRHATKMAGGGTKDHTLKWYLDHLSSYTNWKVLGVTLLEPIEQGPRKEPATP